jgi:hypothetical protein
LKTAKFHGFGQKTQVAHRKRADLFGKIFSLEHFLVVVVTRIVEHKPNMETSYFVGLNRGERGCMKHGAK